MADVMDWWVVVFFDRDGARARLESCYGEQEAQERRAELEQLGFQVAGICPTAELVARFSTRLTPVSTALRPLAAPGSDVLQAQQADDNVLGVP